MPVREAMNASILHRFTQGISVIRKGMVVGVSLLLAICALAAASSDPGSVPAPAPAPDSVLAATLLARFDDEHHDLRGVVVMHDGKIIAARYFNGLTAILNDVIHR